MNLINKAMENKGIEMNELGIVIFNEISFSQPYYDQALERMKRSEEEENKTGSLGLEVEC